MRSGSIGPKLIEACTANYVDSEEIREARTSRVTPVAKRSFDVLSALTALLILAPIFVMLIVVLLVVQGSPVFIRHRRIGLNGATFECFKFRTMLREADTVLARHLAENPAAQYEWRSSRKLRHDPRVTAIGKLLRKSSIDEIPQLLNIVRGDMSVVGPRPIVADEKAYYGSRFDLYTKVRPGLTGLWQINGRSETNFARRVEYDAHYSATYSFLTDLIIILKTVPIVLRSRGSY